MKNALESKQIISLTARSAFEHIIGSSDLIHLAPATMNARMIKSGEEIAQIREGARVADLGGEAIRDSIAIGNCEIDVAMPGRSAMELETGRSHPDSEIRDSWVWFQSGLNTDGAHNPVTTRALDTGDILSLNKFPMISS